MALVKRCPNCQHPNDPTRGRCKQCKTPLDDVALSEDAGPPPQPAVHVASPSPQPRARMVLEDCPSCQTPTPTVMLENQPYCLACGNPRVTHTVWVLDFPWGPETITASVPLGRTTPPFGARIQQYGERYHNVSRLHATLHHHGSTLSIEHQSSSNPTRVNGTPIHTITELHHGDVVHLAANFTFTVRRQEKP